MPTVEIIFFAVCAVVVIVLAWLIWATVHYRKAAQLLSEACDTYKGQADAIDVDRQNVAGELAKAVDERATALKRNGELIIERERSQSRPCRRQRPTHRPRQPDRKARQRTRQQACQDGCRFRSHASRPR